MRGLTLEPASITQITHVAEVGAAAVLNLFKDGSLCSAPLQEDNINQEGTATLRSARPFFSSKAICEFPNPVQMNTEHDLQPVAGYRADITA